MPIDARVDRIIGLHRRPPYRADKRKGNDRIRDAPLVSRGGKLLPNNPPISPLAH